MKTIILNLRLVITSNENDNSAMGYDDAHSSDESEVKMMDWFYLYLKERRKNQHLFGQWQPRF